MNYSTHIMNSWCLGMVQLGDALFTTTQKKVLGLLYVQPDKSFYTKEIIRLTGMGVATIKRELDRMLAAGILSLTKIGNQHHYQANPECPIYFELLGIVKKTFGVTDVIKAALLPVMDQIDFAFVYGSMAKGEETSNSDVDVMIISSSLAFADVMALLPEAEKAISRPVNPGIYTLEQFNKKIKNKNAFVCRVMDQHKLWLKGSDDDIRAAGKPVKNKQSKK